MSSNHQPPNLTISESLSGSTVGDTSSTYNAGFSTPTSSRSNSRSLCQFFTDSNYSPPSGVDNITESHVLEQVNRLFDPIKKSWDDLNEVQRIKISFLLLRKQAYLISEYYCSNLSTPEANIKVADMLWGALHEDKVCGRALMAFVRKGGDVTISTSDEGDYKYFETFLSRFPMWGDSEQSFTIFNGLDKNFGAVESFMRFQADTSTLCYLVAVTNAIFYSMSLQTGTSRIEAIQQYALNISQYQRNRFTHDQIFRTVFLREGGDPKNTIHDLLQPDNPTTLPQDLTRPVSIHEKYYLNKEILYHVLVMHMKEHGPLIIEAFKIFPEMMNGKEVKFGGDFKTKGKCGTDQNINHTMLVVGVSLTCSEIDNMGGMEFLVQNSWEHKPFLIIGYDLLRSMGVNDLLAIESGLRYQANPYNVDGDTIMLKCGSPTKQFEVNNNSIEVVADDFSWGVSNDSSASCASKKEEEESVAMNAPVAAKLPSYWMPIDPKKIAYILT
jgi:hypothetical protein